MFMHYCRKQNKGSASGTIMALNKDHCISAIQNLLCVTVILLHA